MRYIAAILVVTLGAFAQSIPTPMPGEPIRISGPAGPQGIPGPVSSVGLSLSGFTWLSVGGSPITSSGTITLTPTTAQASHQVIGTCGTATTFLPCNLLGGDIPAINLAASGNGGVTGNLPVTNLNGGTGASSSTCWHGDGTWGACGSGSASPLTTKGDLFGHSTIDARIPVGTDGTCLVADSTQVLGLKWSTCGAAGSGVTFNSHTTQTGVTGATALSTSATGADAWRLNLTGNTTLTMTGQTDGELLFITACQPVGGGLTLAFPTGFTGAAISPVPNACTTEEFQWHADTSLATFIVAPVNTGASYVTCQTAPVSAPTTGFLVWYDCSNATLQVEDSSGVIAKTLVPGTTMTVVGKTIDVNTAAVATFANAGTYTAGAKQVFTPSATTAGVRIVAGALPSVPVAGDLAVTAAGLFALYDGANDNLFPYFAGSGTTPPTAPTAGYAHYAGGTFAQTSVTLPHAISFSIGDPAGSALTAASTTTDYVTVPFACTISAYNLLVDAGTVTVKFWKIATGTAIPTVTQSISTSGVSISAGTAIHSTTVTDFTTTAVAANDIVAMNVTAVATAKFVNGTLQCDQSN